MTKNELIREVSKRTGQTIDTSSAVINAALDVAADALADGQAVKLHQFGTLETRTRTQRTSRNFQTGEQIIVPSSVHVAFVSSPTLKQAVNKEREAI